MTPLQLFEQRKKIGASFENLRINHNISISSISRITKLSRRAIKNIETGIYSFNIDTYIIYTNCLNRLCKKN